MDATHQFLSMAGWERNHIETYLALIKYGPMTRSALIGHLTSSLSPNAMSSVLTFLEGHGAVEEQSSGQRNDGAVFRARPPDEVLNRQHEDSLDLLRKAMLELVPSYDHNRAIQIREKEWSMNNPRGVERALQSAVDKATKRLLVMDASLAWVKPKHLGALGDRLAKMDKVLFVISPNSPAKDLLAARKIPYKIVDKVPVHVVVADDEALMLCEDLRSIQRTGDSKLVGHWAGQILAHAGGA